MKPQVVSERITRGVEGATVQLSGEDCSFVVTVVSSSFAGKRPLERQRAVLGLFDDELRTGALHALTVIAKTPDEA